MELLWSQTKIHECKNLLIQNLVNICTFYSLRVTFMIKGTIRDIWEEIFLFIKLIACARIYSLVSANIIWKKEKEKRFFIVHFFLPFERILLNFSPTKTKIPVSVIEWEGPLVKKKKKQNKS